MGEDQACSGLGHELGLGCPNGESWRRRQGRHLGLGRVDVGAGGAPAVPVVEGCQQLQSEA